jgi:hypothetical protein
VRGLLWLVAVLLFVYAAFELFRGYRLRARPQIAEENPPDRTEDATPRLFESNADEPARREAVRRVYEAVVEEEGSGTADAWVQAEGGPDRVMVEEQAGQASGGGSAPSFQSELEVRQLRQEIARLETQVAVQREELAALGDELRLVKSQMEAAVVPRTMSPEYSEALVFARRGLDAEGIAERCGISKAEAELVHALARRGPDERESEV